MGKYLSQFKKGVLELVVLKVLSSRAMYGYEIAGEANARFDELGLREGTLYPILYRLEDDGMVASRWESGHARSVPKKYYAITDEGRETLAGAAEQWLRFARGVSNILEDEP